MKTEVEQVSCGEDIAGGCHLLSDKLFPRVKIAAFCMATVFLKDFLLVGIRILQGFVDVLFFLLREISAKCV